MTNVSLISDLTTGGAAVACRRLVEGLGRVEGVSAGWIASSGPHRAGGVVADHWPHLGRLALCRLIRKVAPLSLAARRFERATNAAQVLRLVRRARPDVIHLHNLHAALPFDFVTRLPQGVPVVWTLHDMWPLTGYCCYSYDCRKYVAGCTGECPQWGKWGARVEG